MSFNNNENQNFDFLDGITIISFLTQMENIQSDNQYIKYIKTIIHFLIGEIDKLHKENDDIIAKLDLVMTELKLLERRK